MSLYGTYIYIMISLSICILINFNAVNNSNRNVRKIPSDMCANEDLDQHAHQHSMIRIFVFCMKNMDPWLFRMCSVKILIRLLECAG